MLTKDHQTIIIRICLITTWMASILSFTPVRARAAIHYVKWNAGGANNGTSWLDAYTDLQLALSAAANGDELWVAAGTYKPTTGIDRTISFTLKNGVSVYGGFAGTETSRDQRDLSTHVTVLSGDLGGNDNGNVEFVEPTRAENAFHVVSSQDCNNTTILDGFTISGGNADQAAGTDTARGGGMWNGNGSPMVTNIIFTANTSRDLGGGMFNENDSRPSLTNVSFTNNFSERGGGLANQGSSPIITHTRFANNNAIYSGGGVVNISESNPIFTDVTFVENSSYGGGGGMGNIDSATVIMDSTFYGNEAPDGGGIYSEFSDASISRTLKIVQSDFDSNHFPAFTLGDGGAIIIRNGSLTVQSSTFTNNTADYQGGAILIDGHGPHTIEDSTFFNNHSQIGGAIHIESVDQPVLVRRNLFSNNSAENHAGAFFEAFSSAPFTIENNTFYANDAVDAGAVSLQDRVFLINNTFSDNSTLDTDMASASLFIYGTYGANIELWNNIFANGSTRECYLIDTGLSSVTGGNNLVEDGSPACLPMLTADPGLGALAMNGGTTQTMALNADSSLIDAGDDVNCPDTDQRGAPRPQGSHCDIGAYEAPAATIPPTATQTATVTPTPTATPVATQTPTPTVTPEISHDRDTTGVFRPSNGLLYLKNKNETGFADIAINYGLGGDYPVVGDWDGDGDATIGIYRNGKFYLRNSNTLGFADMDFPFGQIGDQPVAGDWDGNGTDTVGIYRPSIGRFLLRNSNDSGAPEMSFYLGNVGDVGIAGDWDGDGKDTIGVFRPINGIIFLKNINETGFADVALNYGIPGDKPVTGDWNNDGVDTIGVYRNGQFLLRNSNTVGFADIVFGLGNPGDMPIAGNWDGLQ